MIPLPPISVAPSSSSQANARSDATQAGVYVQPFTGDFTVFGGGRNTGGELAVESPRLSAYRTYNAGSQAGGGMLPEFIGGIPTGQVLAIAAIGGLALWILVSTKKRG